MLLFNAVVVLAFGACTVSAFTAGGAAKPFAARGIFPSMWKTTSAISRKFSVEATIPKDFLANPETVFDLHPRRFQKATKQIATLGPSCDTFEMIEKLFLSGADVFRLNFSHGEHHEKEALIRLIREVEKKYNHPIAVLADLQGPKLRVGTFADTKVKLKDGQSFTFDLQDVAGTAERVRLPHPEILNTLRVGDTLLLDDGKLRMRVTNTTMALLPENEGSVTCEVIHGGTLSNKKGVNTPSVVLPISPLTPKDRRDLAFILSLGGEVDWVALSFVQTPQDMVEFRQLAGSSVKLMAKLEKPSAIDFLEEIVALADGVMVARGDLGVEMNPWDVPVLQKRIVETCKTMGKPVVIATQMMESMIDNPTPTRAEASDTATAIYDSSDAVMLSAESAAGRYPLESVTMQQRVINTVETDESFRRSLDRFALETMLASVSGRTAGVGSVSVGSGSAVGAEGVSGGLSEGDSKMVSTASAISLAARQVAEISNSKAIVAFSSTGDTALRMARLRPKVPILAVCSDIRVARWLALVWGVYPIMKAPHEGEFDIQVETDKVCKTVCDMGYALPTEVLTVTAGLPWGAASTTNTIRVTAAAGTGHWFDKEGKLKQYETGHKQE